MQNRPDLALPSAQLTSAEGQTVPAQKAWITPTFERMNLADAMAGLRGRGPDLTCS